MSSTVSWGKLMALLLPGMVLLLGVGGLHPELAKIAINMPAFIGSVAMYLASFVSVIVGGHLFIVVSDPGAVRDLYLLPFALIAPALLLGLLPAWLAARCSLKRPESTRRIVVAGWGYVTALVVASVLLERRNIGSSMLPFVFSMMLKPISLLGAYGLFVGGGWTQASGLLALGVAALSPLLIVLFAVCRWGGEPAPDIEARQ